MPNLVKVVSVHPDAHSVDVEMADGRKVFGVPVLSPSASSTSGQNNLPHLDSNTLIVGMLDYFDGEIPFINGFLFPQVSQNLFTDNRSLNRHHSGGYTSITESGEMEVYHPSGLFVRLGEDDTHEDLTGKDYDGVFKHSKNTDKAACFTVGFAGKTTKIKLSPDGTIAITGDITLTGNLTITGNLHTNSTISADEDVITGDVSLKHHTHPGTMEPD